jgi:endonuclease G, mitochondrial
MKSRILFAIVACFLFSAAHADQASCPASYANGSAPRILNEKMSAKTQEVCYQGYATRFSGVTRTPLWSAEHLTKDRITRACTMHRKDTFHPDPNLPAGLRSELSDYVRSGYDRGHMAPSGDMPTRKAQSESFSLANLAPQLHANNAGIWEELEAGTRNLALRGHEVYMVSGPLFEGAKVKQLKKRVMVPTGFYKAVYDATAQQAGVYVTPNTEEHTFALLSVDDLAKRAGIDPFPDLPAEVKSAKSQVITPAVRTNCRPRR